MNKSAHLFLWAFTLLSAVVLNLSTTPAFADVKAIYSEDGSRSALTIETTDDGLLRIEQRADGYFLLRAGKAYSVNAAPGGPEVMTVEALAYSMREQEENGEIGFTEADGPKKEGPLRLIAKEEAKIAGFDGVVHRISSTDFNVITLAKDPKLLVLGKAVASYFDIIKMISNEPVEQVTNLYELLATHGVLALGDMKLISISYDKIDPVRFDIPAKPLTMSDLVASKKKEAGIDESKNKKQSSFIQATYLNHTLFTLDDEGKMQAWQEGAKEGAAITAPQDIRNFCAIGDKLFLIAANQKSKSITLWSGMPTAWTRVTQFQQSKKSYFRALDCSGKEPLLLRSDAIQFPLSGRTIAINSKQEVPGGFATTLQYNGYLYVGLNAGEWGGGLQRYPLTGGAVQAIDGSDSEELCGGILNTSCDPVTGLAPDPKQPDCILATIGLVHFRPRGSIARICGGKPAIAYAKPYTLETGWRFDPEKIEKSFSSVAFYSLNSSKRSTWAIGSDGIYNFGDDAVPAFKPFPRVYRLPSNGIDWSNPEFVLLITNKNQRHSISGNSLIMVPR
jgi:hypothetical protein